MIFIDLTDSQTGDTTTINIGDVKRVRVRRLAVGKKEAHGAFVDFLTGGTISVNEAQDVVARRLRAATRARRS